LEKWRMELRIFCEDRVEKVEDLLLG